MFNTFVMQGIDDSDVVRSCMLLLCLLISWVLNLVLGLQSFCCLHGMLVLQDSLHEPLRSRWLQRVASHAYLLLAPEAEWQR